MYTTQHGEGSKHRAVHLLPVTAVAARANAGRARGARRASLRSARQRCGTLHDAAARRYGGVRP